MRRLAAICLLIAALFLVILGQFYFARRQDYLWDGLVLHLLAAGCFLLSWRLANPAPSRPASARRASPRFGVWLGRHWLPAAGLALALGFSASATLLVRNRAWNEGSGEVVALWGLGLALVAAVALGSLPPWQIVRARLATVRREAWLEAATVAALTVLALLLRVPNLGRLPFTLGGDEAWHGLLARQVLRGEMGNPFVMGYMSMPTAFYWPLSWSLRIFGDNVVGLRLPAALVGTATVPLLYLLARRLWGRRVATLAALLLATYDYHLHYSRLAANNVWDPFFLVLIFWLLDRGLTAPRQDPQDPVTRHWPFLLAGLVLGFAFYFYTGARLLPLLMAVYVAFVWLRRRRQIPDLGTSLVLLALACLAVAGPMLGYALSHPDEWNARINQVGILQSGWLEREPALTGKGTAQILAEQFLRAAGAFHVFADRTVWYGAERPLLGFLAGALALLGMAWAIAFWRQRRHFLVLIWFWSVIVTGGMLTESPPSSQRLVMAIPAVVLLVAVGLDQSVDLAYRFSAARWQRWQNVTLAVLAAVLALFSVRFYFVEFAPSGRYGSQNGETATMIGHYLRDLEGPPRVYFFGAPRIYWSFGTMAFLAPEVSAQDVVEPLVAPPDIGQAGRGAVYVFLPERSGELAWVRAAYPGGQQLRFLDGQGGWRFTVYEVP